MRVQLLAVLTLLVFLSGCKERVTITTPASAQDAESIDKLSGTDQDLIQETEETPVNNIEEEVIASADDLYTEDEAKNSVYIILNGNIRSLPKFWLDPRDRNPLMMSYLQFKFSFLKEVREALFAKRQNALPEGTPQKVTPDKPFITAGSSVDDLDSVQCHADIDCMLEEFYGYMSASGSLGIDVIKDGQLNLKEKLQFNDTITIEFDEGDQVYTEEITYTITPVEVDGEIIHGLTINNKYAIVIGTTTIIRRDKDGKEVNNRIVRRTVFYSKL